MCRVIYICADIMMNCYLCGEWVSKTVYIYLKSISYNMKTLFVLLGMFIIYPCLYAQDAELQACREELARGDVGFASRVTGFGFTPFRIWENTTPIARRTVPGIIANRD
jgi:hypothetical protein